MNVHLLLELVLADRCTDPVRRFARIRSRRYRAREHDRERNEGGQPGPAPMLSLLHRQTSPTRDVFRPSSPLFGSLGLFYNFERRFSNARLRKRAAPKDGPLCCWSRFA